jgi:pimeloyl-ACP methyl ester carboxylesterase
MSEAGRCSLGHDSLGCVRVWRDFPDRLAAATGQVVIAYDRLGFGASQPHDGFVDAGFIRDEARRNVPALRDALAIDRMILFGHSVAGDGDRYRAEWATPLWR